MAFIEIRCPPLSISSSLACTLETTWSTSSLVSVNVSNSALTVLTRSSAVLLKPKEAVIISDLPWSAIASVSAVNFFEELKQQNKRRTVVPPNDIYFRSAA